MDSDDGSLKSKLDQDKNQTTLISPDGLLTYFTHIFANSKDMINLFSLTRMKIILWNEASAASMGYTVEDFDKVPLDQHYPPEEFSKLAKSLETLAKDGYAFEKVKMYTKTGELKDLWTRSFIIQREPEVISLVHTVDVTEEKRREDRAVREAKLATLGEASAVLSHELNNALQLIECNVGVIELKADSLPEGIRGRVEKIKAGVARMSDIVSGVMKYSQNSKVNKVSYASIAGMTQDALSILRGFLESKAIAIEVDIPADTPLVKVDSGQVQQILIILAKNAAQALIDQPVRRIRFSAQVNQTQMSQKIRLVISDTGPGISAEIQKNIFDAFSTTKPVGIGLGLGLSIAKRLAVSNRIEISFHSESGKGVEFYLDFDVEKMPAESGVMIRPVRDLKRMNVLIVDDNANNLASIQKCLGQLQIRAMFAASAREGLKLLSYQNFDCIFCGVNMYPIHGEAFAREARLVFKGPLCFVGTDPSTEANSFGDDKSNISYLKKPFSFVDIEELMKKWFSESEV